MARPLQLLLTSWVIFRGSPNSAYNDGELPPLTEESVRGQSPKLNSVDTDFSGQDWQRGAQGAA